MPEITLWTLAAALPNLTVAYWVCLVLGIDQGELSRNIAGNIGRKTDGRDGLTVSDKDTAPAR